MDKEPLVEFIRRTTKNMTFKEAYERTGIALNISVTDSFHDKCRLLNYINAPNVFIWSAVIASCSLPFVVSPSKIYAKSKNN